MTKPVDEGGQDSTRIVSVAPAGGSWWSVSLSDGSRLAVLERSVAALDLRPGGPLNGSDLEALHRRARTDAALNDALRLLSYRPRAHAELRQRLGAKGHGDAAVSAVLVRLTERGQLDDERFALAWARDVLRRRPAGLRRLVHDLRRKGVAPRVAERAAAEALREQVPAADEEESERVLAREALRQRVGDTPRASDPGLRRRAIAYLRRRGFRWEAIRAALRAAGFDNDQPLA